MVFNQISEDLMTSSIQFIVTDPLTAFVSHILISITLAFILAFPFLVYAVTVYLSPALYPKEKRGLYKIIIPSTALFLSGCVFAYFFIIPTTFKLLYEFAGTLGAVQFFLVNEFIYLIFGLMITTGIIFLLPIFMILLTFLGFVGPNFWLEKWKYSLMACLVFSAVVTPDGTGVTMALLCIPLVALYLLGCIITSKKHYN